MVTPAEKNAGCLTRVLSSLLMPVPIKDDENLIWHNFTLYFFKNKLKLKSIQPDLKILIEGVHLNFEHVLMTYLFFG